MSIKNFIQYFIIVAIKLEQIIDKIHSNIYHINLEYTEVDLIDQQQN